MPLNADRPINRAIVVGCAISATRKYLKLHMPRRLNPLFSNNRAKTLKLCSHSRPPVFELPKSRTSYKSPIALAALPVPYFPRLRALALFGRRSLERAERLFVAGVQKPAHRL